MAKLSANFKRKIMKIPIKNLTALIQGLDLNLYQRSLALEEWHKLLNHVDKMEQASVFYGFETVNK